MGLFKSKNEVYNIIMEKKKELEILATENEKTDVEAPVIANTATESDNIVESNEAKTPIDKKKEIWRVVKFVLFSASAGVIQTVLFTLMNEIGQLDYWLSYLTALVASVIWNFTFNRKFTFKAANNVPIAMIKVAIYYAIFTPASVLWGNALEKVWNEYAVLALTMFINMTTEFIYQKYIVFRNAIDTDQGKKKAAAGADTADAVTTLDEHKDEKSQVDTDCQE